MKSSAAKLPEECIGRDTPAESRVIPQRKQFDGWAMVSWGVWVDQRLKHSDIRVYGILACCRRGPYVSVGQRLIARYAKMSQRKVSESMARLQECEYVECSDRAAGRRGQYKLTDPRFSAVAEAKTPAKSVEVAFAAPLVTCPKCGKGCGGLLKVGWCRGCNWLIKVDALARKVAREEIAAEKTA